MKLQIKQGETLSWTVTDDSGDISGTTITAALEKNDFYLPLTVTPVDLTIGTYTLSAGDTSEFPLGNLQCDIKYSAGGVIVYSDTFEVQVAKRVTL